MSREKRAIDEVAPPEFLEEKWGTTDPEEALEAGERAPSTTPLSDRNLCPVCLSAGCRPKPGFDMRQRKDANWKCGNNHHFDEPVDGWDAPAPDDLRARREEVGAAPGDGPVSQSAVITWEQGEKNPCPKKVRALLRYYDAVEARQRAERLADAVNTAYQHDPFLWVDEDDLRELWVTRQLQELDKETLTELAIRLYRPWDRGSDDPSYRDLGEIFPYSRQWVGDRVRAWKDGQFRDLVEDPRPSTDATDSAEEVSAE